MSSVRELAQSLASPRLTRTALADGSGVLLDVDGLTVYSLNETGMMIVEAICDGIVDEDALVARLVERFDVDAENAGNDLASFVAGLSETFAKHR